MLVPINQEEEYASRALLFAAMSNEALIEKYNRLHASPGIVSSKLRYLSQLNAEIESRGLPSPKQYVSIKYNNSYGK